LGEIKLARLTGDNVHSRHHYNNTDDGRSAAVHRDQNQEAAQAELVDDSTSRPPRLQPVTPVSANSI
jgi:hypothetical protein